MSKLTVFCQQEWQVLEIYFSLRYLPGFIQPQELFSRMKSNLAQEEATKILQNFDIENDKIRCTYCCALQGLILYVKRLVQLFLEVKGNVKRALWSHEIVNWIYQDETRRYVEQINENPLHFEADVLCFGNYLNRVEQKLLQVWMVDGDAWTGLITVHHLLENTLSVTDCHSEGHYTVLTLEHLLLVDGKFSLNTLLQSTTAQNLLMIS